MNVKYSLPLCINVKTHLLEPVIFRPSSHYDDRPENEQINMIVIHNISLPPGEFGTEAVEQFFCGQLNANAHPFFSEIAELKVAAHLFIRRNGETFQFVPFDKRAWHAGESYFQGKKNCNDFSIGIELEGTDTLPYEIQQYQEIAKIIHLLIKMYPGITKDRIVGHEHIAPLRKTDPGPAFDWQYLQGLLS